MNDTTNTTTLADFLEAEIQRRNMSAKSFAEFIGVSHTTVNKFLEFGKREVGYPSVDFILKLSKATGTDVGTLMAMIDPDVPHVDFADSNIRLLVARLQQLSDDQRNMVDALVTGLRVRNTEGD